MRSIVFGSVNNAAIGTGIATLLWPSDLMARKSLVWIALKI